MAFWDKVTDVTKQVTEKTNEMIEIGKLTAKISGLQKEIDEKVIKIGDYYLDKFDSQEIIPDEGIQALYEEINSSRKIIAEYNAQMDALKGLKKDVEKAAEPQEEAEAAPAAPKFCPECGAALGEGKFCTACGAKIGE